MPEPTVTTIDDEGYLRICIGTICTTCSSSHLVPDKIAQLQRAMTKLTPEQQIRSLRTEPHPDKPGGTDVEAMWNRTLVLDALYTLAGRDHKDSPSHGLYTGLWAESPSTLP